MPMDMEPREDCDLLPKLLNEAAKKNPTAGFTVFDNSLQEPSFYISYAKLLELAKVSTVRNKS
ncbi:hypothetical protein ColTof4_03547 [Colletotrichum tofieldiae]|nr:hypothetical protein ColTof3_13025 [Colletotrichum tofieldiae]GKT71124.1 hypothetical protein ColTof4_03547 [Colletotrichum tofieldiae]GKT93957.1 hypothetical protein Ct61P_11807 [Colletotrichum tofieldiae]